MNALPTASGVFLETRSDYSFHRRADRRLRHQRAGRVVKDRFIQLCAAASEGRLAAGHFIQQSSEGKDIAAPVRMLSAHLFGRAVRCGPRDNGCLRSKEADAPALDGYGKRRERAMHEAAGVRLAESAADLNRVTQRDFGWEASLHKSIREERSLY
jgi:hypothetical protein